MILFGITWDVPVNNLVLESLFHNNNKGKMRLSPREIDKIQLHYFGNLAQKRLARGLRLNLPEAVALISAQVFY